MSAVPPGRWQDMHPAVKTGLVLASAGLLARAVTRPSPLPDIGKLFADTISAGMGAQRSWPSELDRYDYYRQRWIETGDLAELEKMTRCVTRDYPVLGPLQHIPRRPQRIAMVIMISVMVVAAVLLVAFAG